MHGQGDRIARSTVDGQDLAVGVSNADFGEVSVLDHACDDDVLHFAAQLLNHRFEQVMSQRSRRGRRCQPAIDARRLKDADQNWKGPLPVDFAEIDNLLVIDLRNDDPRKLHFDEHSEFL